MKFFPTPHPNLFKVKGKGEYNARKLRLSGKPVPESGRDPPGMSNNWAERGTTLIAGHAANFSFWGMTNFQI